jgi:integrase
LYTDDEVRMLLKASLGLSPNNPLRKWTYHGLLGLLAVSGLRISEVLSLRLSDVDLQNAVLTVRGTKFGKCRLVPLHNNHNNDLKNLFKGAAISASTRPGPFRDFYVALLAKGMRPPMARLTLARKIVTITPAEVQRFSRRTVTPTTNDDSVSAWPTMMAEYNGAYREGEL